MKHVSGGFNKNIVFAKRKFLFLITAVAFFLLPKNVLAKTIKNIYQINKIKDGEGSILSSVKVYINDQYIHHYAPETLEFCDGCYCDNDKEVECGFGEHIIRLEKSGYQDWVKTRVFEAKEDLLEVNPIMFL